MTPIFDISFDVVALVVAIAGAVVWMYKKVLFPFFKTVSMMFSSVNKIDEIYKQMFTNGGSSLRDAINRIEQQQYILKKRQEIYILDSQHGIMETDTKGNVNFVNRTLCNLLGKTERELMGKGWTNSIPEGSRQRVLDTLEFSLENEIEFFMVHPLIDRNQKVINVRTKLTPIKTARDTGVGFIGIIEEDK